MSLAEVFVPAREAAAADQLEPVRAALAAFPIVTLEAIGESSLLNRIDRKFLLRFDQLETLLSRLAGQYSVVEARGEQLVGYSTVYFDTPDLVLYKDHHQGRARRYKVRVRRYGEAPERYLEVKLRTGAGRTVKQRVMLAPGEDPVQRLRGDDMLGAAAPAVLNPALEVNYTRFTLIAPAAAERITFDMMMTFGRDRDRRAFPDAVVVESKQHHVGRSAFIAAARAMNMRESGLSKYCAGLASLGAAKANRFRAALRRLEAIGKAPGAAREGT